MHKRASKFERSTGWGASAAGGAQKREARRSTRADVSQGSQKMSDGGVRAKRKANGPRDMKVIRERLKNGGYGKTIQCPFCNCEVSAKNLERHIRRQH